MAAVRILPAVAAVAIAAGAASGPQAVVGARTDRVAAAGAPSSPAFVEHRYRIIGKIRLALFWMGRDDVGGARMTWRSDGHSTAVALLAGSDPQRAPRRLNQWAYVREETRADAAEVFALRSLDDDTDHAPSDGIFDAGNGARFGASCASIDGERVSSAATTVSAVALTYRMFDRLLDRVAAAPDWKARHTRRPPGSDAGFLSALERLLRAGPDGPVRASYVHNGTLYDLSVGRRRSLGRTIVDGRTFEQLTRADLVVRNRTTLEPTRFAVTYVPTAGIPLPIQIFYQPSFWVSIELRLDDGADVPADPAEDVAVVARIRSICDAARPAESDRGR